MSTAFVTRARRRNLATPSEMSVDAIEAEIAALDARATILRTHECKRDECDGNPHVGFPFQHSAKVTYPKGPLEEAWLFDEGYRERAHLRYLSDRLSEAIKKVEGGESVFLTVSMPPRSGKSQLCSVYLPMWILHKHPDWKIGLISHSPQLATQWGRDIRRMVENYPEKHNVHIAHDAGAVGDWQTTDRGNIVSRSAPGQSITGKGFKVMLIDDPVKDFAAAHSANDREAIWDWWKTNAYTRLEGAVLVVVIATRWHEDDFIGRLLSPKNEDDLGWEQITFPAIAEEHDVLGRGPGQPLFTPVIEHETEEEAVKRWKGVEKAVGSYTWAALYQQRPAPPEGAIFNVNWWRYWTLDPNLADGKKVILLTAEQLASGRWLDSWDLAFKGNMNSDYVVGQRWCKVGSMRILVAQKRGRWSFTDTLAQMRDWGDGKGPYGRYVHRRLVEDAANGPAVMDTLRDEITGIKAVGAYGSKEARARAVSPEVEAGNVLLPLPVEAPWITDLASEIRAFPTGANDDQVDSLTQALADMRDPDIARVDNPQRYLPGGVQVNRLAAARTGIRRGY